MNIRIRKATVWDVDAIKEMEVKSDAGWSRQFDVKGHAIELLKDPKEHVHFLYRGKRPVGYVSFREHTHEIEVSHVVVVRKMQGRGYGKRLMQYVIRRARALGMEKVRLRVRNYNPGAIILYTTLGFQVVRATKQQVLGRPFVLLVMEKRL
jgi:ribosomal-protein-alanine N-acetyltransferase